MVHGIMTTAVASVMMNTDLHLFPRSDSKNAKIGNGTISAGLTSAANPQIAPHTPQFLDFPEHSLSVSNNAAPNASADREVSQRRKHRIAMGDDNAHIHPENSPAFRP